MISCLVFAALLMFWHAWDKSSTYDEVGHIQCGYYHWQHRNFERGLEHPPLIRLLAALPLNFLNLQDPELIDPFFLKKPLSVHGEMLYGTFLVYRNIKVSAEKILLRSRGMIILTTLLLFYLVYRWSKEIYGNIGGTISLFLMVTSPSFLAHGSLVTTDVGGVAGALLALYTLSRFLSNPSRENLLLFGVALGVAQVCKLSNLMLIPVFSFFILIYPGIDGKTMIPVPKKFSNSSNSNLEVFFERSREVSQFIGSGIGRRVILLLLIFLICGLIINCCYAFENFLPPHEIHPQDLALYQWHPIIQWVYRWLPLPDFYLKSVGFMTYHSRQGFGTFFLGKVLPQGVWYYFPIAFVLRTPVFSLIILFFAFYSLAKKIFRKDEFLLICMMIVYAAATMTSKLNLGIRHFLMVYPLLYIFAGRIAEFFGSEQVHPDFPSSFSSPLREERKVVWCHKFRSVYKSILIFAILFQLYEVISVSPHFLAYFNLAVGGASHGIHYMSDSDYGQDLKALGNFLKKEPGSKVVLSYFGTALPEYYGIDAQELLPTGTEIHSKKINSNYPQKEFLAISASHLQGHMVGAETFEWLRNKKPIANLGYSILIYDITEDVESHQKLAEIYGKVGEREKSERHLRRVKILRPQKVG